MTTMFRIQPSRTARIWIVAALVAAGVTTAWFAPSRVTAQAAGPRHKMTKVTETTYRADSPGTPGINATSWVFINDADVLVVDSEGSPASARSLLAGVASVTDEPVRYLVGTHFHIEAFERKKPGASPDDALKTMDLTRFRDAYGNGVVPSLTAVRRMYDIIDGGGHKLTIR